MTSDSRTTDATAVLAATDRRDHGDAFQHLCGPGCGHPDPLSSIAVADKVDLGAFEVFSEGNHSGSTSWRGAQSEDVHQCSSGCGHGSPLEGILLANGVDLGTFDTLVSESIAVSELNRVEPSTVNKAKGEVSQKFANTESKGKASLEGDRDVVIARDTGLNPAGDRVKSAATLLVREGRSFQSEHRRTDPTGLRSVSASPGEGSQRRGEHFDVAALPHTMIREGGRSPISNGGNHKTAVAGTEGHSKELEARITKASTSTTGSTAPGDEARPSTAALYGRTSQSHQENTRQQTAIPSSISHNRFSSQGRESELRLKSDSRNVSPDVTPRGAAEERHAQTPAVGTIAKKEGIGNNISPSRGYVGWSSDRPLGPMQPLGRNKLIHSPQTDALAPTRGAQTVRSPSVPVARGNSLDLTQVRRSPATTNGDGRRQSRVTIEQQDYSAAGNKRASRYESLSNRGRENPILRREASLVTEQRGSPRSGGVMNPGSAKGVELPVGARGVRGGLSRSQEGSSQSKSVGTVTKNARAARRLDFQKREILDRVQRVVARVSTSSKRLPLAAKLAQLDLASRILEVIDEEDDLTLSEERTARRFRYPIRGRRSRSKQVSTRSFKDEQKRRQKQRRKQREDIVPQGLEVGAATSFIAKTSQPIVQKISSAKNSGPSKSLDIFQAKSDDDESELDQVHEDRPSDSLLLRPCGATADERKSTPTTPKV
jgi:hypothetical protein